MGESVIGCLVTGVLPVPGNLSRVIRILINVNLGYWGSGARGRILDSVIRYGGGANRTGAGVLDVFD